MSWSQLLNNKREVLLLERDERKKQTMLLLLNKYLFIWPQLFFKLSIPSLLHSLHCFFFFFFLLHCKEEAFNHLLVLQATSQLQGILSIFILLVDVCALSHKHPGHTPPRLSDSKVKGCVSFFVLCIDVCTKINENLDNPMIACACSSHQRCHT